MKLKYETGIATFVQFVLVSFLNIIINISSIVSGCAKNGGDCVWQAFASSVFILLIVVWFGGIWLLGYTAQKRRSRRLAQLLIMAEFSVFIIAGFNARHGHGFLNRLTSFIDVAFALLVIYLAFRLMRAKGGRIVSSSRSRRRRKPTA
ncbi:MAG: hypothetical protein QFB86_04305, partial [Patescibacteria group bacterium]|nr:hypothetical protein [Patescibacteria group bacterium]